MQGDPHTWPLFPGPSIGLLTAHSNMLTFYFALFPSDRCPKQIRPLQVFLKPFCLHFRKPLACHKLLLLFILDGALYPPASQREHHTLRRSPMFQLSLSSFMTAICTILLSATTKDPEVTPCNRKGQTSIKVKADLFYF